MYLRWGTAHALSTLHCTAGKAHLREALLAHEEALRVNRMCRELRKKDALQEVRLLCCLLLNNTQILMHKYQYTVTNCCHPLQIH
jgi:hypothetical protein